MRARAFSDCAHSGRRLCQDSSRCSRRQCCAAAESSRAGEHKGAASFKASYHSDGHYKATIEDVFRDADPTRMPQGKAPWAMGWQTNERNIMWNDDLKLRLIKALAAAQGPMTETQLQSALEELVAILPEIQPRLSQMKPDLFLRVASDVDKVAEKLLHLKEVFPEANCGRMLAKELGLMNLAHSELRQCASALREFLPRVHVDSLVQEHPSVLSVQRFKAAVDDAKRLMPNMDVDKMLNSDPDFVLSLQKGSDMIPYDALPPNPWGHT